MQSIADSATIERPVRRPWVSMKTLAECVGLSIPTLKMYNTLPGCPVVRFGRLCRYDLDEYREWLKADGPTKGRAERARQLREKHG